MYMYQLQKTTFSLRLLRKRVGNNMLALWHTRTHTNTTPSTSGVQTKPSFVTYPLLYFTTNFCESTFSMSSLPARSRVGGSLWHSSLLDPLSFTSTCILSLFCTFWSHVDIPLMACASSQKQQCVIYVCMLLPTIYIHLRCARLFTVGHTVGSRHGRRTSHCYRDERRYIASSLPC